MSTKCQLDPEEAREGSHFFEVDRVLEMLAETRLTEWGGRLTWGVEDGQKRRKTDRLTARQNT